MSDDKSVTHWIEQLKAGSHEAAEQLWSRYAEKLVRAARARLKMSSRRVADEEDVALSVFHAVCNGAVQGRFDNLSNRDELWWILLLITKRKALSQTRKENSLKRGAGRVKAEADLPAGGEGGRTLSLDDLISDEPTPEFLALLEEQHQHLLATLRDDTLRSVARARIEGYQTAEIAAKLGITNRAVTRKLSIIREKWARELERY